MTDRELMRMALDALSPDVCRAQWAVDEDIEKAIEALRARLAQPEPEPVAWDTKIERLYDKNGFLLHQKIKRTPSSEWEDYYPEPQREWQGLTAAERIDFINGAVSWIDVICAIEAKLKEKNA